MLVKGKIIQNIISQITKLFKTDNFIVIIGVFSILPFILISFYNHPIADDFTFNIESRNRGFVDAQLFWYQNFNGRYFDRTFLVIGNSFKNFLYETLQRQHGNVSPTET